MTDKDRIKGAGRELYGRGEEAFGAATDDLEMRARGGLDQMAGKAQSAVGRAGEAIRETAGDAIEAGREYFGQSGRGSGSYGSGQYGRGRQRMGRYSRSGESWGQEGGMIASSPLGFLLITAVAGFALASLLRMRD
jgi:uncharacterized protein YjbJ (UPF0337 family)